MLNLIWISWALKMNDLFIFHKIDRDPSDGPASLLIARTREKNRPAVAGPCHGPPSCTRLLAGLGLLAAQRARRTTALFPLDSTLTCATRAAEKKGKSKNSNPNYSINTSWIRMKLETQVYN